MLRPIKKQALRNEQADEAAYLAHLAAQRNASAFFEKYERSELQELLTTSFCSWLASKDDMRHPLELPSGLLSQMKSINTSIAIILMPVEPGLDLDCREIHQMIRELAVGIYCLNQIPSISLDANYDQSTSCSLPPGYFDTRIGQILIAVDYMLKALWHGVYMPKEKRVRFSELWRSSMDIDQDGVPQTLKTPAAEFCQAGLIDITKEPEFRGIYDENMNEDPTYNPNSVEEKMFFMQFADHIILKLTFATTKIQQYEDVFLFDAAYNLTNAIRMTEDHLDAFSYQRLQQRLTLQLKLVKKHLEKKEDIQKNIAYMKLICFLIPFIINLKRKNKVPNLSRLLQPYSDDKVKTERELPPFMLGTDFKCQHFLYAQNQYFHLHGGIEFDVGTPSVEDVSKEVKAAYDEMHTCAINHLTQLLDPDAPYREHYSIPVMDFDGKRYYVIGIELEAFYMLFKSQWWGAINEIISILKPKRLPLTDTQAMDQFKKRFGYKKAIKCKSLSFGMKSAADRGLAAIFLTFCRRTSINSLAITDDNGYAYIHHAAIYNRVAIIAQVVKLHLTINQKRSIPASQGKRFQRPETKSGRPAFIEKDVMIGEKSSWGPTALHLAAQCSSLEALHFLLALRADYQIPDDRGWLPIHFAAYYDNVACITVLYRKNAELIEAETQSLYHSTPLLLAAVSGALDSMKYLFSLKANWLKKDSEGNNIIHLAALNFHTEVLKHLIELNSPDLPVWKTLVGMLNCESYSRKKMAIRCLEVLCLAKDDYWKCILQAGTIPSLISLLKSKDVKLECITLGVLSNISTHDSIVRAFVEAGGIPVLIKLLTMEEPELLSRCAVFLYDIAQLDNNQVIIAELGGIPALIDLLEYDLQDLLVNVMSCIRVLCKNNKENQLKVKEMIGIEPLVQFLRSDSDVLVAVASAVIAEISRGNMEMQNAIVAANVIDPLIQLLRGRKISVQVKGAMAIEALCEGNTLIQMKFLSRSVTKFLLKLLKAFHLKVKEQGAVTLWALAGQTLKQQKFMAEQIGYNLIIDMLLSPSDKMQCVGEAHISNPLSQENVVDEGALPILVHLLKTHPSLQIKVEVAFSLACIVLKNSSLQTVLQEKEGFCYLDVLKLFYAPDKDIRLRAGYAIAIFAYNNPTQQILILESGPISIHIFEPLLGSDVETDRAMAAFQIVILAKIIINMDQVSLSARGISILVDLLCSEKSTTLVLTGKLIASLAHTRAGIPEAITSLGTVQRLCYHLYAKEEEVRSAVACALGYLTFNRTAYRHLLVQCRNKPKLFKRLIINLSKDAKINSDFVKEFKRQKKVGLPSLSLEINGGPPAVPVHIREKFRGTGVKVYKGKFRPKDSLFLIPSTSHIMGRLKTPEKPRIPASGHYQFPHTTTSDLIEVSRPRIVNVEALKHSLSKEKF
ncbi:ankyrin and armadillo repeat-containing protein isoform X3 [Crotalus tigris]|uniref:ankyrin and armadillo repeat-containing protein isoform X3 n=1 Tax=Crotalus tigris TaxID=88082 RepID=UPI00192F9E95|nr:ankyrin and armadillo repeat-containing protein isoform X3 [Crotalus tigris]